MKKVIKLVAIVIVILVTSLAVLLILDNRGAFNNGDKWNRRLNSLKHDEAYRTTPPGSQLVFEFAESAFEAEIGCCWSGPHVSRHYKVNDTSLVYIYYDQFLLAHGWQAQTLANPGVGNSRQYKKNLANWEATFDLSTSTEDPHLVYISLTAPATTQ